MAHDSRHPPSRNPLSDVPHRNWWKSYQLHKLHRTDSPEFKLSICFNSFSSLHPSKTGVINRAWSRHGMFFHKFLYKLCVLCVGVIALVPWKTVQPFLLFWIPKALSSRYAASTNFWHHVTLDWKIYSPFRRCTSGPVIWNSMNQDPVCLTQNKSSRVCRVELK